MRARRKKRISLTGDPRWRRGSTGRWMSSTISWPKDGSSGVLTVIDKWHRQCVALQVDFSLTGQSVVDALNEVALDKALPCATPVDHRTEFTSKALGEW
jgi:hypothetical protein